MPTETSATPALRTDDVMADVRAQVRDGLRGRVADPALVDRLEALFLDATTLDTPDRLVLPSLLTEPWRPELTVRITSHRGGWVGRAIVGIKERLLLPLNRWLFEYALGNFRRQDRLNLTMLACLEQLAAENLRLRQEIARIDASSRSVDPATHGAASQAAPQSTSRAASPGASHTGSIDTGSSIDPGSAPSA